MATKIVTKNSSTASAVPTASDLVQGELAVNVADKRLFTEDNGGSIIELGTNPSTIDINAGSIDGTAIGASSASTGAFTTLTASGAFTSLGIDDNADATAITIDSSENVGIGTSSPAAKAHIYDASTDAVLYLDSANVNGSHARFLASGSVKHFVGSGGGFGLGDVDDFAIRSFDNLIFATNNSSTERMRIDSSGNVDLYQGNNLTWRYAAGSTIRGSMSIDSADNITFSNTSSNSERMRIDSSGNLLVGKTATDLDVAGHALFSTGQAYHTRSGNTALYLNRLSSDGSIVDFRKDGTTVGSIGTVSGDIRIGGLDDNHASIRFAASSKAVLPVKNSDGDLSDNTTDLGASSARFKDLYLSGRVAAGAGSVGTPTFHCGSDTNTGINLPESDRIQFITGGTERMRIDASGNLLLNATSSFAVEPLQVTGKSSGSSDYGIIVKGGGGSTNYALRVVHSTSGVVGSITFSNTSTAYNTSSDQRLKENIAYADDAGSKIDAIQVRKFDWKADGSHQDYGMIAQELQTVAPEAVSGDADSEEMMGVDYSKLVPMLIKEIQSLRNRVAQLEE